MNANFSGFFDCHKIAIAVFAVVATLFLWDVLFLGYSLGAFDIILNQPSWKGEFPFAEVHQPILGDSPTAHYPQREFDWGHAKLLKNAEFNPYIFTGMPWTPQGVGAFVTSLPQLFLGVANAVDWATWLRLICAGFFMYLLMLELGLSRVSGIFAGILWTYSLHQVVWLEFPQHLATQLWIPLIFLFNFRILREGWKASSAAALLVTNVLFFTSGYTQIVLYTYITVGVFNTVYVAVHAGTVGLTVGFRRWTGVHAVYVGAVLVCAAGVLAEMQHISEGLRGAQDWRGRVAAPELSIESVVRLFGSFVPEVSEVTQMLTPDYYGGIWDGRYTFERGNIVETARYFGVLGLLFAVAALFTGWGTEHARTIAVFAVVTALGFSLFYRNELTLGLFRLIPFADKGSYSRFITPLTFFGCVLAGYGLHHGLGRRWRWLLASAAVLLLFVVLAWTRHAEFDVSKMWYPAVIVAAFAGAILLRKLLDLDWTRVAWIVVAVTAVDLFVSGYGFNTRMDNDQLFPRNNTIRYLLNDPEPYRVAVISDKPLYHPNILSFYDIPVVEGYSTVIPVDYVKYIDELFPKDRVTRNGILFLTRPNVEALRLMNVKYVLSDEPLHEEYQGLQHVLDSNDHSIFRVRNHLPRMFCASDVFQVADPGEALDTYDDVVDEYDTPVVVAGRENRHDAYDGDCRVGDIEVYTHRATARIQAGEPRYVVIPYAFDENWSVQVNGETSKLERANGYHMAVRIPAGASTVEIVYADHLNRLAAWIFVLVFSGLLIYAWRAREVGRVARVLLCGVSVLVIFKSSLSLPGVRNEDVPERAPVTEKYEVLELGTQRIDKERHSDRVSKGNPVEYPLHVDSAGLAGISLLAGTFHQPRLDQTVTVEILDAGGKVLVERDVGGSEIINNNWFTIRFPVIHQETDLRVRVSTQEARRSKSFILWLDSNGEICIKSFYRPDTGTT